MTSHRTLHELFVLNVCLQLFDGVATYHGVAHWGEGNPIARDADRVPRGRAWRCSW